MNLAKYETKYDFEVLNCVNGYKEYSYDKDKIGELVAECKCDYNDFHATVRLETCDQYDGYVAKVEYTYRDEVYSQRVLFVTVNSTLEQFQKNYGVDWTYIQKMVFDGIDSAYTNYKKKLKRDKKKR